MKKWNVISTVSNKDALIPTLLKSSGFEDESQIQSFLNPPKISEIFNTLPEEFRESLNKASKIIKDAIKENIPVIVYGDYDADGISSTAILYKTLRTELVYKKAHYFIPNRFEHGYGLSTKSIDEVLVDLKNTYGSLDKVLFITVDSGITAAAEVDYIKSLGHSVIITDHHQKPDVLPKADAIVWYDKVVGATIAWLLSRVLGSKDNQTISFAAMATITDLQSVLGFNRSILKRGLEVLNSNPPVGIKKLLQVAGRPVNVISAYDIGWVIGPRLNASGRLVEASASLLLVLEEDENIAEDLAQKLNRVNTERQDKTLEMFELAADFAPDAIPDIIVSANKDYHEGIIGLVAAKLAQKYYRPAIVMSLNEGSAKGSVRSIPGIDIIALLRNFSDLFENLGGHPMAAGFTIKTESIDELSKKLIEHFKANIDPAIYARVQKIDLEIPIDFVDIALADQVEKLEPFGIGNEEPVFCSRDLGIANIAAVGKEGKHLSLKLYKDGHTYKAIYFGHGDLVTELNMGDKVDVAYTIKKNTYNGMTTVDLVVSDILKLN